MMGRRSKGTAESLASPSNIRLRALLSLGMVVGLGAVGTLAAWSDEATATATFSAGELDLTLNGDHDDAVDLTSLTMTDMYPGAQKTGIVTVSNGGTLEFEYNFAGTSDGASDPASFGNALRVNIFAVTADGLSCDYTARLSQVDALLDNRALLSTRGKLQPNETKKLCVEVKLPLGAPNGLQGATANVTFTFTASQIV